MKKSLFFSLCLSIISAHSVKSSNRPFDPTFMTVQTPDIQTSGHIISWHSMCNEIPVAKLSNGKLIGFNDTGMNALAQALECITNNTIITVQFKENSTKPIPLLLVLSVLLDIDKNGGKTEAKKISYILEKMGKTNNEKELEFYRCFNPDDFVLNSTDQQIMLILLSCLGMEAERQQRSTAVPINIPTTNQGTFTGYLPQLKLMNPINANFIQYLKLINRTNAQEYARFLEKLNPASLPPEIATSYQESLSRAVTLCQAASTQK